MWQKLKRIDSYELGRARVQLINAVQLVSAAPRSYLNDENNQTKFWPHWNESSFTIESRTFGTKEKLKVVLDVEQLVLSLYGQKDHVEHLVLSGLTYPMAFGWMQIKLNYFHLNGELFSDNADYSILNRFPPDSEWAITNQAVFSDLVIYYSNAYHLLSQISNQLKIHGNLLINPGNLAFVLVSNGNKINLGFSPGDKDYPEPYFFVQSEKVNEQSVSPSDKTMGIKNTKNWNGYVFLASEFLTLEPEAERNKVIDFFNTNFMKLI